MTAPGIQHAERALVVLSAREMGIELEFRGNGADEHAVVAKVGRDDTKIKPGDVVVRIHPQYWMAAGLLSAAGAGIGAWLISRNFLTSLEWDLHLPIIGDIHLSSTLLFDLGVYLLVIGATTLMLVALAHQSLRSRTVPDNGTTKVWSPAERAETGVTS